LTNELADIFERLSLQIHEVALQHHSGGGDVFQEDSIMSSELPFGSWLKTFRLLFVFTPIIAVFTLPALPVPAQFGNITRLLTADRPVDVGEPHESSPGYLDSVVSTGKTTTPSRRRPSP
jgi:hypothetical protein